MSARPEQFESAQLPAASAPATDLQNDAVCRLMIVSADQAAGASIAELFPLFSSEWETHQSSDGASALAALTERTFRCVVLVASENQTAELEWVPRFLTQSAAGGCPVVFISDSTDSNVVQNVAIEARRAGVASVIPKHLINASHLELAITSAVGQWRLMRVIDLLNHQVEEKQQRRNTQLQRTERFAHELLTPLASVQEYISLVFDGISGPLNAEQASHLAYARGGCASIEASVEALVEAAGNQDLDTAGDGPLGKNVTISKSLQTTR